MAKAPVSKTSAGRLDSVSLGPKLMGAGVALFVLTRIIRWLPLSFLGTWINGFLWPILILCLVAGAGLTFLKSKKS